MAQKVDNTSEGYYECIETLSPRFHDFYNSNYYHNGRLYLSLETKTKYRQVLQDLHATPTDPDTTAEVSTTGPLRSPSDTPKRADKDNESPVTMESTNKTYIKTMIAMGIESMQDMHEINATQIDKMLATLEQMTYDNHTQSTQIEQLQIKTTDQSHHIDTLTKIIADQNAQLLALNGKLKEFDKCKQTYEANIVLISPLSTSVTSNKNTIDKLAADIKTGNRLGLHRKIKAVEVSVDKFPTNTTDDFLENSISDHLDTLVKRTNSHINNIIDIASTKLQLMEEVSDAMASTLDFAFTARTTLKTMEDQFAVKWPDFNANATTLIGVSQDLEKIKNSVCTADICEKNCQADRESVDTIKKSIEKLTVDCILSEKTVATHTTKVQEMYSALVHKNGTLNHNNDVCNDKNECSPPFRDHPTDKNVPHNKFYCTQNSQSQPNGNHRGYRDSHNGYTHPNEATQNLHSFTEVRLCNQVRHTVTHATKGTDCTR